MVILSPVAGNLGWDILKFVTVVSSFLRLRMSNKTFIYLLWEKEKRSNVWWWPLLSYKSRLGSKLPVPISENWCWCYVCHALFVLGGSNGAMVVAVEVAKACISPADINAEETLNTLKYANRARNIQNKPVVNRDTLSNEMLRMRQQLELLQAELCARGGGTSSDEIQVLKERIAWLEAMNEDLCRELHEFRSRCAVTEQCETDVQVRNTVFSGDSGETDEVAKEWEHTILQNSMDEELNELNKRLEQKESEMKLFGGLDTVALKQHFGKKIMDLEDEKRTVQQERDRLLAEVENLAANSDGHTQKMQEIHAQKLKALEAQILDLKKKQENQVQLLKKKQKSDEAAKRLQEEIQFIKAQKVQLQQKIKQEAEQFRQWKASREKELLQLRKEGRKNEYERHKLQALNQRQKMHLQLFNEHKMAYQPLHDVTTNHEPSPFWLGVKNVCLVAAVNEGLMVEGMEDREE
ncbi:Kinesin-like protein KIN-4A [Sarracenia purpurea var. burkii]